MGRGGRTILSTTAVSSANAHQLTLAVPTSPLKGAEKPTTVEKNALKLGIKKGFDEALIRELECERDHEA